MAMKQSTKRAVEVGAGVTAAALAAAAAAYFLSGEEGRKRRRAAKQWVNEARQEIGRKIRTAKRIGRSEYSTIVDQVVRKYGSLEDLSARDVMNTARTLKGEWDRIKMHARRIAKDGNSGSAKASPRRASRTARTRSVRKKTMRTRRRS